MAASASQVAPIGYDGRGLKQVVWSDKTVKRFLEKSLLGDWEPTVRIDPSSALAQRFAQACKRDTPYSTLVALLSKAEREWTYGNTLWLENFYKSPANKNKSPQASKMPAQSEQMLEGGRGTCDDWSAGFVAVCRAAGLPARVMNGIIVKPGGPYNVDVYSNNHRMEPSGFVQHARVEVWLNGAGWVPIETQSGVQGIGVTSEMSDGDFINWGFSTDSFSVALTQFHGWFLKATVTAR